MKFHMQMSGLLDVPKINFKRSPTAKSELLDVAQMNGIQDRGPNRRFTHWSGCGCYFVSCEVYVQTRTTTQWEDKSSQYPHNTQFVSSVRDATDHARVVCSPPFPPISRLRKIVSEILRTFVPEMRGLTCPPPANLGIKGERGVRSRTHILRYPT